MEWEALVSEVDVAFSKKILSNFPSAPEEVELFCAFLMASARMGHLCVSIEGGRITPPLAGGTLQERLVQGALALPPALVEEVDDAVSVGGRPICRRGGLIYINKNWNIESQFVHHLERLCRAQPLLLLSGCDQVQRSDLTPEQHLVIARARAHAVSVVAGGPGTGKTHTASRLVQLALMQPHPTGLRVVVAAPTGRAASRLRQVVCRHLGSRAAQVRGGTLHALLGVRSTQDMLEPALPLEADLIVVDEGSMIEAALFVRLLSSIREGTRLVLMGDPDQLQAVGSGSLFADLLDLPVPRTLLHRSLRCEQKEMLDLASSIRQGDGEAFLHGVRRVDFSSDGIEQNLWDYVHTRFASPLVPEDALPHELLARFDAFRVLCCMRKGPLGLDRLNQQFLQRFISPWSTDLYKVAPILITQNDAKLGLYNGDAGVLVSRFCEAIAPKDYALFAPRDERESAWRIPALSLPPFEYAYCLSVHKSQGSEFDEVLLLAPSGSEVFGREVLYTAVTRAKRALAICGEDATLRRALALCGRKHSGILRGAPGKSGFEPSG